VLHLRGHLLRLLGAGAMVPDCGEGLQRALARHGWSNLALDGLLITLAFSPPFFFRLTCHALHTFVLTPCVNPQRRERRASSEANGDAEAQDILSDLASMSVEDIKRRAATLGAKADAPPLALYYGKHQEIDVH